MNFTFMRSNCFPLLIKASLRFLVAGCLVACVSQNYAYSQTSGTTTQNVEVSSTPNSEPRATEVLSEFFFGSQKRESSKLRSSWGRQYENVVPSSNSDSASTLRKFFGLGARSKEATTFANQSLPVGQPFDVQNYAYPPSFFSSQISNDTLQNVQALQNQGEEFVQSAQNQISRDVRQISSEASKGVNSFRRQGQAMIQNSRNQAERTARQVSDELAQNARTLQRQGQNWARDVKNQVSEEIQRTSRELDQQADNLQTQGQRVASGLQTQVSDNVRQTINVAGQKTQALQKQGRQIAQDVQSQIRQASVQTQNNVKELRNQGQRAARDIGAQTRQSLNQTSRDAQNLAEASQKRLRNASRVAADQIEEVRENASDIIQRSKEEIAAARRQRLDELNALLAAKRPDEFAQRTAHSRAINGNEGFDAVQANRPKIRQAANQEPAIDKVRSPEDSLPVRPQTLQTVDNRSNSGKAIALPRKNSKQPNKANSLEQTVSSQEKMKSRTPSQQSRITKSRLPITENQRSSKNGAHFSEPSFDQEEAERMEETDESTTSETPHDQKKNGVIRSSAKFIDPKDL